MANFRTSSSSKSGSTSTKSKSKQASASSAKVKSKRSISRGSNKSPGRKSNSSGDAHKSSVPIPTNLPKGMAHKRKSIKSKGSKTSSGTKIKSLQKKAVGHILSSNADISNDTQSSNLEIGYNDQSSEQYTATTDQEQCTDTNTRDVESKLDALKCGKNGNSPTSPLALPHTTQLLQKQQSEDFCILTAEDCQMPDHQKPLTTDQSIESSPAKKRGRKKKKKSSLADNSRNSKSPDRRSTSRASKTSKSPSKSLGSRLSKSPVTRKTASRSPLQRLKGKTTTAARKSSPTRTSSISPTTKVKRRITSPSLRANKSSISTKKTRTSSVSPHRVLKSPKTKRASASQKSSPNLSMSPKRRATADSPPKKRKSPSPRKSATSPLRKSVTPKRRKSASPRKSTFKKKISTSPRRSASPRKSLSPKRKSSSSPGKATLDKKDTEPGPSSSPLQKQQRTPRSRPKVETSQEIIRSVSAQIVPPHNLAHQLEQNLQQHQGSLQNQITPADIAASKSAPVGTPPIGLEKDLDPNNQKKQNRKERDGKKSVSGLNSPKTKNQEKESSALNSSPKRKSQQNNQKQSPPRKSQPYIKSSASSKTNSPQRSGVSSRSTSPSKSISVGLQTDGKKPLGKKTIGTNTQAQSRKSAPASQGKRNSKKSTGGKIFSPIKPLKKDRRGSEPVNIETLPPSKKVRRSSFKLVSDPDLHWDSIDEGNNGDRSRSESPRKVTINPVPVHSPKTRKIFTQDNTIPDDKLAMVLRGLSPSFEMYHNNFKQEKITVNQLLSGSLSHKDYIDVGIAEQHVESFLSHFNAETNNLDTSYVISDPVDNSTPRINENDDEIDPGLVPRVFTNTADQLYELSKNLEKTTSNLKNRPELLAQSKAEILPNDKVPITAVKEELKIMESEIKNIIEKVDRIDDKICIDFEYARGSQTQTKMDLSGEEDQNSEKQASAHRAVEPLKLADKISQTAAADYGQEPPKSTLKYVAILGVAAIGSFIAYRALRKDKI